MKSNGLASVWKWEADGLGASVTMTRLTIGITAATHTHQRQRGEGGDPVGVSSETKPMQASVARAKVGKYAATQLGAGRMPGRTTSP